MNSNEIRQAPAQAELAPTRATLLARLKDLGDEHSWRQFFEIYHRLIYGRVIHRGLPIEEAEDIVMEIVEGVARRMPVFVYNPQRCSFKTWLFRIVENRVADHYRRGARGLPPAGMAGDAMALLEEIPDPASLEPDKRWEEAWEDNLIQAALDAVRRRANPRYLQIYLYTEVEGHSVAETARHLQTTASDVSLAKHRIREMLREEGERLRKEEKRREEGAG
jgi:RNA polymerase sigma factor (sigma-70 family)